MRAIPSIILLLLLPLFSCINSTEAQVVDQDKAVLIINGIVNPANKSELQPYLKGVMSIFVYNGGKPLARYKTVESLVGEDTPEMIAIIEFPDPDRDRL